MNRIAALFAIVLCVLFIACGAGRDTEQPPPDPTPTVSPAPGHSPTPAPCADRCEGNCDPNCCRHKYRGRLANDGTCRPCLGPAELWDCTAELLCHDEAKECKADCCVRCPKKDTEGCQIY